MQLAFEQQTFRVNELKANNKRAEKANHLQGVLVDLVDSMPCLNYSTKRTYKEGCACVYLNDIYVANADTSGVFNPSHWNVIIYV